jgi:hypothetical protein
MVPKIMFPVRSSPYAILIALLLIIPASAAGIQVALGDTVPLSGYSSGSSYAYLFLTGPNLPANGVMLNDITKRADQGYFTKVTLDGDDHWSYKWSTANVGGRLDEGTYTIWVVNGPNDLSHLSQADYGTISVSLGKPGLAVDTPQQPGSMDITSTPSGASVTLNDKFRGQTPLTISDLTPGTYPLVLTHYGYNETSTSVIVQAGRVSEVSAVLAPRSDIPPAGATTTAAGANLPATSLSPTPTVKSAGFMPAIFLLGVLFLVRKLSKSP